MGLNCILIKQADIQILLLITSSIIAREIKSDIYILVHNSIIFNKTNVFIFFSCKDFSVLRIYIQSKHCSILVYST